MFGRAGDGAGDGLRTAGKRLIEAVLAGRKRAEQGIAALCKHAVDLFMRIGKCAGDFGSATTKSIAEGAGAIVKRAFEHFLAGSECSRQCQRLIGHCRAKALDAAVQHGVEGFRAACNGFVDASQALHQLAVEAAGTLVEGTCKFGNTLVEGGVDQADGRLQAFFEQTRTQIEIHDRVVGRALQVLTEGQTLFFQRRAELVENGVERAANDLLAAVDIAVQFQRARRQGVVELTGALFKRAVQAFCTAIEGGSVDCEALQQHFTALVERRGKIVQAHVEFVGERRAGGVQSLQQVFRLGGNQAAHGFGRSARFFEECRRARIDHRSESLAGGGKAHRQLFADDRQFFLDLLLRANDGRADAFGVIDDGVTFRRQFLHEAANAQFVVGVAALKCVDFGVDQGFEFGGTGNGALDAVIHGRNFAANRLTDRHDAVGGNGFRLCQTQGDFRHGACGIAKVTGARHHDGEGEEQHDRDDDADNDRHQAGDSSEIGNRCDVPKRVAVEQMRDAEAADRPDDRHDRRVAQRTTNRAAFQRFQNHRRAAFGAVIGRFQIGGFWRLFGRSARRFGCGTLLSVGFLQSGLRLLRRCRFSLLRRVFKGAELQGVFQRLKCSLVDGVANLVVRHAVTPRYTYARLHAVEPVCRPQTNCRHLPAEKPLRKGIDSAHYTFPDAGDPAFGRNYITVP